MVNTKHADVAPTKASVGHLLACGPQGSLGWVPEEARLMKMNKDQKQNYMQAVHYRSLSDRLMRSATSVCFGAIFLYFIGIAVGYMAFMLVIGAGLGGAAYYLRGKYWRCPACGESLPAKQSAWQIERCPKCGVTLADEGERQ